MNVNDQNNSVSLKEHLLALLAAEREMANQQKTFIDLRFELAERALELDHVEMLRRLDLLTAHRRDPVGAYPEARRARYEQSVMGRRHSRWQEERGR